MKGAPGHHLLVFRGHGTFSPKNHKYAFSNYTVNSQKVEKLLFANDCHEIAIFELPWLKTEFPLVSLSAKAYIAKYFCWMHFCFIWWEIYRVHGWWTPFRRNGVRNDQCDWFASIFATGLQRWKGWDRSSTEHMVNLTHHWLMHIIISPWNIIELCRTVSRDIATKKRQIVTIEVKNL